MEGFLQNLLPRMLPDTSFAVHAHQGKSDLLAKIEQRLRGYARWLPAGHRIVVVVDRDEEDCTHLKQRLEAAAAGARLRTRSGTAIGLPWQLVTRMAIGELEAWYFADWSGVRRIYPRLSENTIRKVAFRDPDAIRGGTWEAFERVLQRAGYFAEGLPKLSVARAIGREINPDTNSSRSFVAFRDALREAVR